MSSTSGNVSGADGIYRGLIPGYEGVGSYVNVLKVKPDASTSDTGGTSTWPPEDTLNMNRYLQFAVVPKPNTNFAATSLSLLIGAKGIKGMNATILATTDTSFASPTVLAGQDSLPSNTIVQESYTFHAEAMNGETLYVRIYPWIPAGTVSATKYLYVQNLTISGTTTSIPAPASVLWPDSVAKGTDVPTISGLLNAGTETFSDSLYTYPQNTQVNGVSCVWMTTVSHSWTAETSPNFTRYVQYALSPMVGGTFYADSVAFSLGAAFTNNLRAGVYCSYDSTFTTKVSLISDTALVASTLVPFSFSLNDTVKSGETLYLRIYPYDTHDEGWAKLMYVWHVFISGATTGLAIELPTLSTAAASYISTTFATSGGTISADGGGAVTARGVCWDTASAPSLSKNHTSDGIGTGSFTSSLTGLTPGKKYYVRAYAANAAGTAYGNEISFSALASVVPPSLTTTTPTNILVKTALSGGTVTDWGGDTVKVRGVCWNTTGNPTVSDSKTEDGNGVGTFKSGISGLKANTTYYVRAYATNSAGTGYGDVDSFTTQAPAPSVVKVVAQDGSGDYTTLQAAFNDVPNNYTGTWTIFVKKGIYHEKDTLIKPKINVYLLGEDRDSTIITYGDYADSHGSGNPGTSGSFTVAIDASDFTAADITIQNTYSPQQGVSGTQAVALRANGDRQAYYNCKLLGYQDTYYTWGGSGAGRLYHKNCYIEGTVDFIFGRDIAVFDSCTIHEKRNNGTLTAASTDAASQCGYVFRNCTIVADSIGYDGNPITTFYLGRPWQGAPRTVFLNCYEPANLNAAAWLAWNVSPAQYAEYRSSGPGASPSTRVTWSSQLGDSAAATFTLGNIFSRNTNSAAFTSDWLPSVPDTTATGVSEGMLIEEIPSLFSLSQNYPNPFNPATNFRFTIAEFRFVTLKVYDVLGRKVATVVNERKSPGTYEINFNAGKLSSGVYFYRLSAGTFTSVKKMIV
ncbi:MAG: T9SS type A sorting domain-containing protein, partial [Bacteroidota bacterium]|nr:T9SS type A sorting domain-containing protein [Bacteroidota bacterium]